MNVFGNRIWILQDSRVLAQELQVLGGLLQKHFHEFCSRRTHRLSCKAVRIDLR